MRKLLLRKRERIAIVRRRLNEETLKLGIDDPEKKLHWFVLGCMGVLDGDETALNYAERKAVKAMRADWLRLRR